MVEQEWEPKRARRARARAERKKREAEQARARRRRRWIAGLSWTLGSAAVIGFVAVTLLGGRPEAGATVLAGDEVESAREAAGCTVVASSPSGGGDHLEASTDPSLVLSGEVVPPTGDAHYSGTQPPMRADVDRQLDAMALGHNLEHGAVAVWYDPERVDPVRSGLEAWANGLNAAGFESPMAGATIFVSPFVDPGLAPDVGVALRSWSLGVDCEGFDELAAGSFVVEAYGRRGGSPEGVPYPDGLLAYEPGNEPIPYAATQTGTMDPAQPGDPGADVSGTESEG